MFLSLSKKVSISFLLFAAFAVSITTMLVPNAEAMKTGKHQKRKTVEINSMPVGKMSLQQVQQEQRYLEKRTGALNQMDVLSRLGSLKKREQQIIQIQQTEPYKQITQNYKLIDSAKSEPKLSEDGQSIRSKLLGDKEREGFLAEEHPGKEEGLYSSSESSERIMSRRTLDKLVLEEGNNWIAEDDHVAAKKETIRKRIALGMMVGSVIALALPAHMVWQCDWWNAHFKNWGLAPQDDPGCRWIQNDSDSVVTP